MYLPATAQQFLIQIAINFFLSNQRYAIVSASLIRSVFTQCGHV